MTVTEVVLDEATESIDVAELTIPDAPVPCEFPVCGDLALWHMVWGCVRCGGTASFDLCQVHKAEAVRADEACSVVHRRPLPSCGGRVRIDSVSLLGGGPC